MVRPSEMWMYVFLGACNVTSISVQSPDEPVQRVDVHLLRPRYIVPPELTDVRLSHGQHEIR